jgi:hypothetical protein
LRPGLHPFAAPRLKPLVVVTITAPPDRPDPSLSLPRNWRLDKVRTFFLLRRAAARRPWLGMTRPSILTLAAERRHLCSPARQRWGRALILKCFQAAERRHLDARTRALHAYVEKNAAAPRLPLFLVIDRSQRSRVGLLGCRRSAAERRARRRTQRAARPTRSLAIARDDKPLVHFTLTIAFPSRHSSPFTLHSSFHSSPFTLHSSCE